MEEGKEIGEGFSSKVYEFSLTLQMQIGCVKSWEIGS